MHRQSKLLLAALTAALILAAAVGTASAGRLLISNTGFRMVWTPLTAYRAGEAGISCNVTVEGTLHSNTIVKRDLALVGYITRAAFTRPCVGGGEGWVLNGIERHPTLGTFGTSLPWHIRYRSFRGTLPNITGIGLDVIGVSFVVDVMSALCLFKSTTTQPYSGTANVAGGVITGFTVDPTAGIPRAVGGFFCPAEIFARGTGTFTLLGNTTPITIRLIT